MSEELLDFNCEPNSTALIKVIGVGGGGSNAVNYMFRKGITDVGFVVCNTDAQALENSPVPITVQLGESITAGRGAGNMPELGEQAAEENIDTVKGILSNSTQMVFITAGMGGGTGTGAAPVIARMCREMDILTIAVVTVPAKAEGKKRYEQALAGVERIREHVDSLLVINNEKIRDIYGNLPASQAFAKADEILSTAVKGIAEIITLHGNINIDFADVSTVMSGSKVFIMGTGEAEGENRAIHAVEAALESPLLDSNDISGTNEILLNITSGQEEITIGEIGEIIEYLQEKAGSNANIIWGNGYDTDLGNEVCVTLIATGFKTNPSAILQAIDKEPKEFIQFDVKEEGVFINDELEKEEEELKSEPVRKDTISKPMRKKKTKKANSEPWLKRQFDLFFEEKSADLD
ncbi:MAG: cell division protein FtsZ [Prolixibacteraceae bacterium]|jgi:cell division protein FtsZ|nr:cell division protein FtsZ [Prolixibacteraceae bacterium]